MRANVKAAPILEIGLLLLLGFLWGIPYALTKISLTTIPPITLVAARVTLAAVALWIVVFAMGVTTPTAPRIAARLFLQGVLGCVIPYTLITFGQQSVDSSLASILNSTAPLFLCLISLMWTRQERPKAGRLLGVTIGFGGVIMIAGAGAFTGLGKAALGQSAILAATLSSAIGIIHARRFGDIAPEVVAAGTLTSAALVLVPLCLLFESPFSATPSATALAALAVNAVIATALGFVIYFRLVRTVGSVGTASVGYLRLGFGVLFGCVFMGEPLTWTTGIGLVAIMVGVGAINGSIPWRPHRAIAASLDRIPNGAATVTKRS